MPGPNLIILYVADPVSSSVFYRRLLECEPLSSFPTFVSFAFSEQLHLGLWSEQIVSQEVV